MIENHLGFPSGISGGELAIRAMVQARRFDAALLLARADGRLGRRARVHRRVVRRHSRAGTGLAVRQRS
jgi:thioredoxin reductase (NADPH)